MESAPVRLLLLHIRVHPPLFTPTHAPASSTTVQAVNVREVVVIRVAAHHLRPDLAGVGRGHGVGIAVAVGVGIVGHHEGCELGVVGVHADLGDGADGAVDKTVRVSASYENGFSICIG